MSLENIPDSLKKKILWKYKSYKIDNNIYSSFKLYLYHLYWVK